MPSYVIGLDLGQHSVKAALLKGSFRGYEVEDFLSLEPTAAPDGGPAGLDEQMDAAARILETIDRPQATVVMALPAARCSNWLISMPFSDRKQIAQTLRFEVENYVPWDLSEVALEYLILDTKDSGAQVFVAMAPLERIAEFLERAGESELDPRHLSVDAALLALLGPASEECIAIIDLGHSRTLICVTDEGRPLWLRDLDGGTQALGLQADGVPAERLEAEPFKKWLQQLRSSLMAAENAGTPPIDRVLCCGGGAELPRWKKALSTELGIPVDSLPLPQSAVKPEEAPAAGPEHALAYALALRAFDKKSRRAVEFRKGQFSQAADTRTRARVAMGSIAAVILLAIGGLAFHGLRIAGISQELKGANATLIDTVKKTFPNVASSALGTPETSIAVMREKVVEIEDRIATLKGPDMSPLEALRILSDSIPNNITVDVDEYLVNEEMIRVRGETDSFGSVDRIETAIRTVPSFESAKKSDVNKARGGKMRFVVTIPKDEGEEVGG